MTINKLVEKRTTYNLSNQKLIEKGTNNMLKKHLVEEVFVSPIPMQTNDVSVNLVIGVIFTEKVCPKGHIVFQASPLLTLWLQYKKLAYLLMCLFIFFIIKFLIPLTTPR
jgi:hypothetical protein